VLPKTYDIWRLQGPPEHEEIGENPGETCNRVHEPDEDAPRSYKPKPCNGLMDDDDGTFYCDRCGAIA
jgi:hypothetical protein